jgi:hypothetical protein
MRFAAVRWDARQWRMARREVLRRRRIVVANGEVRIWEWLARATDMQRLTHLCHAPLGITAVQI